MSIMALRAIYKDGVVTLDDTCNDQWWMSHSDFDKDAFLTLIATNVGELDSEKRAEHLTELQDFIVKLQLESLQGRNEELLDLAHTIETQWKELVVEGVVEDEVNAAKVLEQEKEDITFEPMMDTSEFAEWFSRADNEGKRDMIKLLEKALETEGIPELEKERISEMLRVYSVES